MAEEYNDINPLDAVIDKEEERRILMEISQIDGIHELLRAYLARDMRSFFSCQKEEQDTVRGAFLRTQHLISQIKKHSSVDNK